MSPQFRKLLHLRQLKRGRAVAAFEAKRHELRLAEKSCAQAEAALQSAMAAYHQRVEELYAPLLGKAVTSGCLQDVAVRIAELDEANERLSAECDEARRHLIRFQEEVAVLTSACLSAQRASERFERLVERTEASLAVEKERFEEAEHDEGFARNLGVRLWLV